MEKYEVIESSENGEEFISSSLLSNDGHNFIIHRDDIEEEILTGDNGDGENSNPDGNEDKSEQPLREQDRFLPIANIAKIMKKAIPETGKIAKDARECVQECVSEFISFITSEASERCFLEKRKTINGEDILFAMNTLGFDNYIEPLKIYLQKYRETTKGDKSLNHMFEEVTEDVFPNHNSNENMSDSGSSSQNDNSVIYTYSDQMPHFNLV
ncbi:hypothetical protein V9T40_002456 [Parthenolecanium corni]|uniref:Nuclear transcription factor Y subunit beta n=1 Tax=Parthenolecanium corni TaxID=536013 RepID=A0AAN9TKT8_9HEMI